LPAKFAAVQPGLHYEVLRRPVQGPSRPLLQTYRGLLFQTPI